MTPRELALCAEGYRWRDEREWESWAYRTAVLLQPWGFEGRPKDLLPTSASQSEAAFEQLAGISPPSP